MDTRFRLLIRVGSWRVGIGLVSLYTTRLYCTRRIDFAKTSPQDPPWRRQKTERN